MNLTRRGMFVRAAMVGALGLSASLVSGCSADARLDFGAPASYTPPPPGIDELYRTDLVAQTTALMQSLVGAVVAPVAEGPDAQAEAEALPLLFHASLQRHLEALRTGAENETAGSDGGDGDSDGVGPSGEGASATSTIPATAEELSAALVALRDLYADACLQVSDSLATVCASAGSWAAWACTYLSSVAGPDAVTIPAARDADTLAPAREVPETDPPSEAPLDNFLERLSIAQDAEWFAAYALEVAAARSGDGEREMFLEAAQAAEIRGELYGSLLEAHGGTPVPREAGYPLPRPYDEARMRQALRDTHEEAVAAAVQLTGLAPFDERAALTWTWERLGARRPGDYLLLDPLPGLHTAE